MKYTTLFSIPTLDLINSGCNTEAGCALKLTMLWGTFTQYTYTITLKSNIITKSTTTITTTTNDSSLICASCIVPTELTLASTTESYLGTDLKTTFKVGETIKLV